MIDINAKTWMSSAIFSQWRLSTTSFHCPSSPYPRLFQLIRPTWEDLHDRSRQILHVRRQNLSKSSRGPGAPALHLHPFRLAIITHYSAEFHAANIQKVHLHVYYDEIGGFSSDNPLSILRLFSGFRCYSRPALAFTEISLSERRNTL